MPAPSDQRSPPSPPPVAGPLIRSSRTRRPTPDRRRLVALLVAGAVALLLGAVAGWRTFGGAGDGGSTTDTTAGALALAAPIGGAERRDGPWARLRVKPARPGANAVGLRLTDAAGTPVSAGGAPLGVSFASLDDPAEASSVAIGADGAGELVGEATLEGDGWWRAEVTAGEAGEPAATLPFYLLLPDPNLHGTDAVEAPESDAEARAVFERGLAALTALHRVRFREALGDGRGNLALADWAIDDGTGGGPPAYSYRAPGGLESIVVGDRRWLRRPGEGWEAGPGAPAVPPAEWGGDYADATGFRLGGEETVDGEPCRIVTFAVPERTEPRRLAAAWYAWWVGAESGQLRREAMVSRNHYMARDYAAFDAPLAIAPPADLADPATPAASPSP